MQKREGQQVQFTVSGNDALVRVSPRMLLEGQCQSKLMLPQSPLGDRPSQVGTRTGLSTVNPGDHEFTVTFIWDE